MIARRFLPLLLALATGVAAQSGRYLPWEVGESQFLNREYFPWWNERYENYSSLSYRDYASIAARTESPTYDPFGTYLLDGVDLLRVEEFSTLAPQRSSRIFRNTSTDRSLADPFRNLVVMRDQYQDWSSRIMIGDALPARFSSLTLDLPRLQGLRWDASSFKNGYSLVAGRVSEPVVGGSNDLSFAAYLLGGRWESRIGDVLTFGASFVNLHLRDSLRRRGSLRGNFPTDVARGQVLYLVVSDDSPGDDSGPVVHAVELSVDGTVVDAAPSVRRLATGVLAQHVPHLRRDGAWAVNSLNPEGVFEPGGLLQDEGVELPTGTAHGVDGTDLLIFAYPLPESADEVNLRVQAAGDYSLDLAAAHSLPGNRAWVDWHNVARAPGNVRDGSNLGWTRLNYGFPTGMATFGSNMRFRWQDTTIEGEVVENVSYHSYPDRGQRRRDSRHAFYLKGSHERGAARFGGELFDIPADLTTSLRFWSNHAREPVTFDLVADNDDDDHWVDSWEHWDPLDPTYIALREASGIDPESQPTPAAQDFLPSAGLARNVGYGVFPGLDNDADGVFDLNVNENQLPDHAEPFLMYSANPDQFVYGDDANSNGVVDARENDNTPDLPYDRDTRGYHLFAEGRARSVTLRGGHYRFEQRAGDGRSRVGYLEASHRRAGGDHVSLAATARLRRIRDDIADPVYETVVDPLSSTNASVRLRPDLLLYRSSLVTTLYADARYDGPQGLHLRTEGIVDVNRMLQGDDRSVRNVTLIGRSHWTLTRGRATLSPMAKLLVHRRTAPRSVLLPIDSWELFPILRLDYAVGESTTIRTGVQGLPLWPHLLRNRESPVQDFDARHFIFVVQNRSNYTGFTLSLNAGYKASRTQFVARGRGPARRFREFFIQARVL